MAFSPQVLDYTDNSNSSVDGLKIVVEAAVARMNKLGILSGETLGQMFHSVGNQLNGQSDKKTKQKRQKVTAFTTKLTKHGWIRPDHT